MSEFYTKIKIKLAPVFQKRIQFLSYLFVGGLTFIVEFASFLLLREFVSLSVSASQIVSYSLALVFNFTCLRRFVFSAGSPSSRRQLGRYLLLVIFNLIVSTLLIRWLVHVGLPPAVAKLGTIALVAVWNFIIYKRFVFRAD